MNFKITVGALLVLAIAAGCAGPTAGTPAPSSSAPEASAPAATDSAEPSGLAPAEIKWWILNNTEEQTAALQKLADDFAALNPGVTVKIEERDVDPHKDALRTALGTDATPDIYFMWAGLGLGGEFVQAGGSADLVSYYEQYGWNDRFVAPGIAAVTQYGGYHGVPWTTHGQVLFYRKDAFETAGITSPPTTYDELTAAADKLKAAGVTPIEFGGTVNWHVMRLLDNILETKCGVETHDSLKALATSWATEPCVAASFTELKRWADNYLNANFIAVDNDESSQLLYSGKAAMALEGDWFNGNVKENDQPENYGLFAFPTGTGRLYDFTEAMYISANSKVQDQAAAFLDFATSKEQQATLLGVFASQSVTKDVVATNPNPLDSAWIPILEASTGIFSNADQAFPLEITTEYWRIQNLVATGELDPATAGAEFQKFIDNR
jgi:raffinose/stachyose/melibiose transport system substrate-binding protein